ncbi:MAG: DUF5674 family protein [bacterium]|nr:DUF5674 family protein [bacterium]
MATIKIIEDSIPLDELREIAKEFYGTMVKGVVDIEKGIVAFGGEYHMDSNIMILDHGSRQGDVWGFNIYPDMPRNSWIEYVSLINIRPLANNRDMEVQDPQIRARMKEIIESKII